MSVIIEFLFDPNTGTQPVRSEIDQLIAEGTAGDAGKLQLYKFVQRGLEFLEHHGIPRAAVIKQTTHDPDFERIAAESDVIYADFIANPEKYITF